MKHLPTEMLVRLGTFALVFAAMAGWEVLAARRQLTQQRASRWLANLGLVVLGGAVVRLAVPLSLAAAALAAEQQGWGLLARVDLPPVAAIVLSVIALDLVVYLQHVLFHAVPVLWRLHSVHHSDLDFDFTTGVRFHPVEILLSMGLKLTVVVLLGVPPLATLIFEVLLNGTAMFNHGNVSLPPALERVVRWLLVTPDMHRVHHSVERSETNSNFGFCLSCWDRLLGTYRRSPRAGHDLMQIGLSHLRDPSRLTLPSLLLLPFHGRAGPYPIGGGPDDGTSDHEPPTRE